MRRRAVEWTRTFGLRTIAGNDLTALSKSAKPARCNRCVSSGQLLLALDSRGSAFGLDSIAVNSTDSDSKGKETVKILVPVTLLAEGMEVLHPNRKSDVKLGQPFNTGHPRDKAFETRGGQLVVWRACGEVWVNVPTEVATALLERIKP